MITQTPAGAAFRRLRPWPAGSPVHTYAWVYTAGWPPGAGVTMPAPEMAVRGGADHNPVLIILPPVDYPPVGDAVRCGW